MTEALILGSVLGVFSGMVPGPFTALIAATALKSGFGAGMRIAAVPLVTETLVMGVTVVLLAQLPEEVLRWMGVVGGAFIFYLAVRTWIDARDAGGADPSTADGGARQLTEGATLAVLSPTPWVFWLLIGGPLFLRAWHRAWQDGVAFLGSFLLCLVGAYVVMASLAAYGERRLPDSWKRRLLRVTSVVLFVGGGVLVWQAWIGNFQQMVSGSRTVESLVTDSILNRD